MTTLKHIRKAIRLAGLKVSEVTIKRSGHFKLTVRGKVVGCSSTPKDKHTAALRIARDLRALNS